MTFVYKKIYLPQNREFRCSLQSIKGVGWYKSGFISTKIGIGYPLSINKINRYFFKLAEQVLNTCTWLEARMKKYLYSRIKELIDMNALKGIRHRDFLTVRGQRTRTNGRTQKKKKYKKDYYV